jgi:CheY-like chemotaxis protein
MTGKPKIVIADDDSGDRYLLKLAFEEGGMDVDVAEYENGADLIEYLTDGCKDAPNIIVLDLNMPKKSGFEVLEFLKDNSSVCNAPIVILSTSSDPNDISKSKALGAQNYFIKPFNFNGYIDIVKSLEIFLQVS